MTVFAGRVLVRWKYGCPPAPDPDDPPIPPAAANKLLPPGPPVNCLYEVIAMGDRAVRDEDAGEALRSVLALMRIEEEEASRDADAVAMAARRAAGKVCGTTRESSMVISLKEIEDHRRLVRLVSS